MIQRESEPTNIEVTPVLEQQRAVLRRIHELVHWLKQDLRYRGSKDTAELGAIVTEKLLRRDSYRRAFVTSPRQLWGLLRQVARHAIIDVMRANGAEHRQRPAVVLEFGEVAPTLQHELEYRACVNLVREEMAHFRAGTGYGRAARKKVRPQMAAAFELYYFEDASHAEIAERLNTSKATICNWLDFMRLHIARRVAARERGHL